MVLQVEQLDTRIIKFDVVTCAKCLDEPIFDHPVDLSVELQRVIFDRGNAVLPHLKRQHFLIVKTTPVGVTQRGIEEFTLDIEGADLASGCQLHAPSTGHVVADIANGANWVFK